MSANNDDFAIGIIGAFAAKLAHHIERCIIKFVFFKVNVSWAKSNDRENNDEQCSEKQDEWIRLRYNNAELRGARTRERGHSAAATSIESMQASFLEWFMG